MRIFTSLLLVLVFMAASSQNLVSNGDFEDSVACQEKWDSPVPIPKWETTPTVDIYNEDCKTKFNKDVSNLKAQSGKQYLGFVYLREGYPSETVSQHLASKLSTGCEYEITVYVALGGYSYETLKEYFVILADSPYEQLKTKRAFVRLKGDSSLAKNQWTKFSATYTANGTEQYLFFKADARYSNPVVLDKFMRKFIPNCYLLIDNVSIIKTKCPEVNQPKVATLPKTTITDTFSISDVNFEVNSWQLKKETMSTLISLVSNIKPYPYQLIQIVGHTDNTGSASYNQTLSENRANAVRDYMILNGIDSTKVTTLGMGHLEPLASNDTEDGRQRNRRVVVIVNRGE